MSDTEDERKSPAKRCYDEQVDNINSDINVKTTKKSRQEYYNKKFSKEKKNIKMSNIEKNYDNVILDNLAKEYYTTKSPHLLITKSFHHIEDNSIILHYPIVENGNTRNRKISYKINLIGKNIKFNWKKQYVNILPGTTKNNVIFFWLITEKCCIFQKLPCMLRMERE